VGPFPGRSDTLTHRTGARFPASCDPTRGTLFVAVKIRLMRVGKKKQPTYRVVVADARSPRDGRFIDIIGQYAPRQEPSAVEIDAESALAWLRKGAQPTEQVQKLLAVTGVWAQYEAERSKPATTKLARRGYVTGKVAPSVKKAKEEAPKVEAPTVAAPTVEAAAEEVAAPEPETASEETAPAAEAPDAEAPVAEAPAEDAAAEDAPAEPAEEAT
jgi:small subunit ribosomal protein S16